MSRKYKMLHLRRQWWDECKQHGVIDVWWSDQPCRRDPGRMVSLFVLLVLGWLFVFVFVFAMTDYLRLFTRHHHYHYHYHHLPHQGCHPLIVPCHNVPCSVGDSMRKLTRIISDNICHKMRGTEQIHEKLKWPILFLSQIGTDLLKLRSLIATNWELLCFMIHFTDWRIALGDTFTLACRDLSPDTGSCSCVHGIVHPVYVSCKKLVMLLWWIWRV